MNILITGGTGFVGKKIGARLAKEGHHLFVLTRNVEKYKGSLPYPCELLTWPDLEHKLQSNSLSLESIIHLAGESVVDKRWNQKVKQEIFKSRVDGSQRLVDLLTKYSVKLNSFIAASAIGFYGDRSNEVLDENSSKGSGFLSDVCQQWEDEVSKSKNTRTCLLRLGIVLGPDGGALKKMIPLFKNGVGGALGDGKMWRSWIHIDDLVEMFCWCLTNKSAIGVYNAVSPAPTPNLEFSQKLAQAFNKKLFFSTPALALRILLGEASDVLLSSQRVLPKRALGGGFQFQYIFLEQALKSVIGKH